jgi:hypothetical protein
MWGDQANGASHREFFQLIDENCNNSDLVESESW